MEPEIHSNLPSASPFVAYGEARGPWMNPKLLAIIAGSLVVVAIGALAWFVATRPIEFPLDAPFVMSVQSGTELPPSFPLMWRDAAKQSRTPILVGIARDGAHEEPFIVRPTWHGLALTSDHPITLSDHTRVTDVLPYFIHALRHPTFVSLTIEDGDKSQTISGPLNGSTWMTNATIDRTAKDRLPAGDVSVDLTALPEAWPPIKEALARSGFVLSSDDMPTAIGWSMTSGTSPNLEIRYLTNPSTSTLVAIAAAAGLYDTHPYTLNDGTVTQELRLPLDAMNSTASTSRTTMHVDGTTVFIGEKRSSTDEPTCSKGRPLVSFSTVALKNVKSFFPVLAGFQLNHLEAEEIGGKLAVCFQ